MAKLLKNLKKIEVGNPLINLEMWNLYEQHEIVQTDEQLADFYHMLLDVQDVLYMLNRRMPVFENQTYKMIDFSSHRDENPLYMLIQSTIHEYNQKVNNEN